MAGFLTTPSVPVNSVPAIFRIAAGLCACALAGSALFLFETEEGQLQNRLEELWIRVDDRSKSALTKQAAVIQEASRMLSSGLDRIFGARLISWKSVATSIGWSAASSFLFLWSICHKDQGHDCAVSFGLFIVSIITALAPRRLRYCNFVWPVVLADYDIFYFIEPHNNSWPEALTFQVRTALGRDVLLYMLGLVVMGIFSDVATIIFIRWILAKASRLPDTMRLVQLILFQSLVGMAAVAPFLFHGPFFAPPVNVPMYYSVLRSSGIFTAAASFLIVALLICALLHRLIWPVTSRLIYPLQRYGVFKHPKLLAGFSALLLPFAWPHNRFFDFLAQLFSKA